jgi:hypothetical protein
MKSRNINIILGVEITFKTTGEAVKYSCGLIYPHRGVGVIMIWVEAAY